MKPFTWISSLSFLLFVCPGRAEHRQIRQISVGNLAGVCRYGSRLECCYGWKKNSKGHCEDLNECGLKPRPCEHRCMNTFGSYMCYCLNGYTLMPDGSCANSRTCALSHCQYGCEEVQGEIRCLCPSAGLQLGPDGKTCADIDECVTGKNQCPYNRQCVNTFGSYYCKCQGGYDLKYVDGKYDCVDVNECVSSTHKCSHHAECINTQGSYKCKCKQGFRGSGFDCSVKPFYRSSWDGDKGSADEFPNVIPDTPSRPRILGKFDNTIPEPKVTQQPRLHLQPFDYDGEVYIGPSEEDNPVFPTQEKEEEQEEEEEEEEEDGENEGNRVDGEKLNPRGDVFFPDESVYSTEFKEINAAPLQERLLTDCNFDSGACEWVQDKDDDLDWTVQYDENGLQYYMALSGLVGNRRESARLRLLLTDLVQQGPFCLKFSFRIAGPQVGSLRVMLDHSDHAVWEKARSRNEDWQTDSITIAWRDRAPEMIVFEGTRGKLVAGEIGLDSVVLISGSCSEQVLDDELLRALKFSGVSEPAENHHHVCQVVPAEGDPAGGRRCGKEFAYEPIWDTAGQERFRSLRTPFYRGSDCCLLTFSVDDSQSFRNLANWKKEFVYYADVKDPETFPFVVLGNKVDVSERQVSRDEAQQWCRDNGDYAYYETSAKDATNVSVAFEEAVRRVLATEERADHLIPTDTVNLHRKPRTGAPCC
ncbi:hypothetical protein AOLI_G00080450 [Acnodon oligacanthus]